MVQWPTYCTNADQPVELAYDIFVTHADHGSPLRAAVGIRYSKATFTFEYACKPTKFYIIHYL